MLGSAEKSLHGSDWHVMVCVAARLDLYGSVLDTLM